MLPAGEVVAAAGLHRTRHKQGEVEAAAGMNDKLVVAAAAVVAVGTCSMDLVWEVTAAVDTAGTGNHTVEAVDAGVVDSQTGAEVGACALIPVGWGARAAAAAEVAAHSCSGSWDSSSVADPEVACADCYMLDTALLFGGPPFRWLASAPRAPWPLAHPAPTACATPRARTAAATPTAAV